MLKKINTSIIDADKCKKRQYQLCNNQKASAGERILSNFAINQEN